MPTIADVEAARERLAGVARETPIYPTETFSRLTRRQIFLKAVNTDLDRPLRARVKLRGAAVSPSARVERVVASSVTATNGFATPDAVRITRASIPAARTFVLDLPQHSVAVVTLAVER